MIRLIVALGVVIMLMPKDLAPSIDENNGQKQEMAEVTTHDTLSAASSFFQDIITFCDRNEEACLTGKALANNALVQAKNAIASLGEKQQVNANTQQVDQITTSTIKPSP